jgi:hypothetical protein
MTVHDLIKILREQCANAGQKPDKITVTIDCAMGCEPDGVLVMVDEIEDSETGEIRHELILEPTYKK